MLNIKKNLREYKNKTTKKYVSAITQTELIFEYFSSIFFFSLKFIMNAFESFPRTQMYSIK